MFVRIDEGEESEFADHFAIFYSYPEFNAEAYWCYQEFLWEEEGWKTAQLCMPKSWELIFGRVT